MLTVTIRAGESFDNDTNQFIKIDGATIVMEHSLVSISKWEKKWKKPFLEIHDLTNVQFIDYVRCMTITQNVDPNVYYLLDKENYKAITDYMNDPMTATTFAKKTSHVAKQKLVTSEYIYFMMFSNGVPIECEKWHINRLMALLKIFDVEGGPKSKMKPNDVLAQNARLNKVRRAGRPG